MEKTAKLGSITDGSITNAIVESFHETLVATMTHIKKRYPSTFEGILSRPSGPPTTLEATIENTINPSKEGWLLLTAFLEHNARYGNMFQMKLHASYPSPQGSPIDIEVTGFINPNKTPSENARYLSSARFIPHLDDFFVKVTTKWDDRPRRIFRRSEEIVKNLHARDRRNRVASRWLRLAQSMSLDEAYRFMGLAPGSDLDDVKNAYRLKVMQFHPDRGGDPEDMKQLNIARSVIESGGQNRNPSNPSSEHFEERMWNSYRDKFGPKPSGRYSDTDLKNFAKDVIDYNLLQVILRESVPWVPADTGTCRGGQWSYNRPFGSRSRTFRITPTSDPLTVLKTVNGKLFDMKVNPKEAWVTWELPNGRYQSISFQKIKAPQKKAPGVGMTRDTAAAILRREGLNIVAGGSKYSYWSVPGTIAKTGVFLREAARTLRVVQRGRGYSGIEDNPLTQEYYFGKLTEEILVKLAKLVKAKQR